MEKVLSAEGLGEKVFSGPHAAALLNLPGTKWKFVRNHDPEREPNTESAAKAEPSTQDGGGPDATGAGKASRKGVGSRKRRKKLQK